MAKLIRLTSDLRADFVAYLDGELDEEQTERIETVIAQSEVARSDMEALAKTYELLDILDRPEASAGFTERTMSTIRLDEVRPDPRDAWWYRAAERSGPVVLLAVCLIATAVLGFLATSRWITTETDQLVRELPLIEQLDLYTEVGDVEFLQRLSSQDALLREMSPSNEENAE